MGMRDFLRRADKAVQDTRQSVTATAVVALAALLVAVAGLIVAIVRR